MHIIVVPTIAVNSSSFDGSLSPPPPPLPPPPPPPVDHRRLPPSIIFLCIALRSTLRCALRRLSHLEAQIQLPARAQGHKEQSSSRHPLATLDNQCRVKKTRPLHAAGNRTLLQQEKAYAPVMSIGLCVGTRRSSVMCSTGFWGSKQNRIAIWAPTKPPARNGQFAKTFLGPSTLTLACARHAAFAPAHGISQK